MDITILAPVTSVALAAENGQNFNKIQIFSNILSNHELKTSEMNQAPSKYGGVPSTPHNSRKIQPPRTRNHQNHRKGPMTPPPGFRTCTYGRSHSTDWTSGGRSPTRRGIGLHLELKQKRSSVNQKSAVKDRVGRVHIHLGPEAVLLLVAASLGNSTKLCPCFVVEC